MDESGAVQLLENLLVPSDPFFDIKGRHGMGTSGGGHFRVPRHDGLYRIGQLNGIAGEILRPA
jgi:hypothetical protein